MFYFVIHNTDNAYLLLLVKLQLSEMTLFLSFSSVIWACQFKPHPFKDGKSNPLVVPLPVAYTFLNLFKDACYYLTSQYMLGNFFII